jgi:hypothetical protein
LIDFFIFGDDSSSDDDDVSLSLVAVVFADFPRVFLTITSFALVEVDGEDRRDGDFDFDFCAFVAAQATKVL